MTDPRHPDTDRPLAPEELATVEALFIRGAMDDGIPKADAKAIWNRLRVSLPAEPEAPSTPRTVFAPYGVPQYLPNTSQPVPTPEPLDVGRCWIEHSHDGTEGDCVFTGPASVPVAVTPDLRDWIRHFDWCSAHPMGPIGPCDCGLDAAQAASVPVAVTPGLYACDCKRPPHHRKDCPIPARVGAHGARLDGVGLREAAQWVIDAWDADEMPDEDGPDAMVEGVAALRAALAGATSPPALDEQDALDFDFAMHALIRTERLGPDEFGASTIVAHAVETSFGLWAEATWGLATPPTDDIP